MIKIIKNMTKVPKKKVTKCIKVQNYDWSIKVLTRHENYLGKNNVIKVHTTNVTKILGYKIFQS